MCIEHGLGKAARFEQAEAQQHRVAHASPDGVDDVIHKRDILHQNGVDGNADDNQERLEAQRQQGADVVLPHAAPFLAHHGRHWDGGNRGDEIYFNHSSECDNENADGQRPHGNAHEQRLEPQAEQRPQLHFHQPILDTHHDA